MNITITVCFADIGRIYMAQPVIGRNFSGYIKNKTAIRISLVGICINTPVESFQIFIDRTFYINNHLLVASVTTALITI